MGKQTKFHPVSLNVLRGAAEYGGFMFGKIRQLSYEEVNNSAVYKCDITKIPNNCDLTPLLIKARLDAMFAADVEVLEVWVTRSGRWLCTINTYSDLPFITRAAAPAFELEIQSLSQLPREDEDHA